LQALLPDFQNRDTCASNVTRDGKEGEEGQGLRLDLVVGVPALERVGPVHELGRRQEAHA
jgi:hypothetical protein